ncbi:cysteine hydrolase family protein [Oceanibacterium hippocampi]|nr:isochorismatase family cysteine hydrolase [Oceanibacterium hippocampi]
MSDVFSSKNLAASVTLDPATTAIVVVDMLNDFCKPGGAMVLPGYERLIGPQRQVIAAGREAGAPIVFVIDAHRGNARQDREFLKRTPHCIEGEWGSGVIDDLEPQADDIRIIKRRYSAFFNTDLDVTLRDFRIRSLVVMGVVTNICVRSTIHDAFFMGYECVVPEDCVAATGPREQESSLYDIATHFGVVSTAQSVSAHLLGKGPLDILDLET